MISRLMSALRHYLQFLFGDFHYAPPAWARRLGNALRASRFGQWTHQRWKWMHANPLQAAKILTAGIVAALVLSYGVYRAVLYYQSRPQPNYATVKVDAPRPPDLEEKKIYPLILRFSESVAPLGALGKPVTAGVSLTPEMQGTWRWIDDKSLEFQPLGKSDANSDWTIGQKYRVRLSRGLLAEHILLEQYDYDFSAPPLKSNFTKREFYQDPRDPKIKRVVINLAYNFPLDTEDFKKRVEVTLQSKDASVLGAAAGPVPFTVSFGKFQNEVYLQTDPIAIPKEDSVVKVTIGKGVRGAKGGEASADKVEASVDVPGMFNYFRFENPEVTFARNERYEPEQVLVINSKADVSSDVVAKKLTVFTLPLHMPKDKDQKHRHRWRSGSEVTDEVRALMKPQSVTLIPTENETSDLHSFKIQAPVGQSLYLKIPKGMKSYGGYELAQDFEGIVTVPPYPKELTIMSEGSLLTLSGDKKLPLLARGIHKVEFKVSRILPEQLNQLVVQVYGAGGDFSHPRFEYFGDDTLAEKFTETRTLASDTPGATQYFSFDLAPYLNKGGLHRGLFYLSAQEFKGSTKDQRLVLLTDLGVIVKETVAHTHEVFVQNMHSGLAVVGASVDVVGANGLAVMQAKTGPDGRASIADLRSFKNEKRPIAFVVHKDADLSFLPYEMASRQLNLSSFDTGGVYDTDQAGALTAFMFSDRGIYRPGDTVNFGLMVRGKNWKKDFKSVPIAWSVTDPRGTEIHREKINVNSNDMVAMKFDTQDFSATGSYEVQVFITKKNEPDQQIGALSVRVEEFLPDRMRISTHLSQERLEGWVSPKDLTATVSLKNLYGTPAENRTVKATMNLVPTQPSFRSLKDYVFNEFKLEDKTFSETLDPKTTDAKGNAEFDLNLARFDAGMYRLRFDAEGFEATGGRAVTAGSAVLVSPLPYLVGYKRDGDLSYIKKDSEHAIEVIAVNSELKHISVENLGVQLVERRYVSSLLKQADGTYKYQSVVKEIPGEIKPFKLAASGGQLKLATNKPGDFMLWFKSSDGTIVNKVPFSVAGEANLSRSLEKNAELGLVLNKKDYKPGEEIEMQIKAPYTGAGLITIERDKVFTSKWFKTSTTATIERIKIPEGVEGNAYVNVTFLRGIDSKEIFMSPLSFAVQPFSVSLDSHRLSVKVTAKDLVKPGSKLHITYSASQRTKLILYGVDEGILLVAGYKLPDPLSFFFRRRALQVRTFQLLDLLLPEYSVLQSLSAPGGDGAGALGRNLNPFKRKTDKPVVFWSGVVNAGPETKSYDFDVPDYFNGTIKVMAVAANNSTFGTVEKPVTVRGDFILTPNVPNFVAPGDEFEVGTGIANQAEGSGPHAKIKIEIDKSDFFDVIGESQQSVEVAEGHEGSVHFRLRAKAKLGSARVVFHASKDAKSAKSQVEFSVRPAVPYMSTLTGGYAEKTSFDIPVERRLLSEFRKQKAALSPVPAVLISGLKTFLDDFPYGCTEQAVSKAMPYILLKAHPEFGFDAAHAGKMFEDTIALLRTRQTGSGGFGLYLPSEPDHVEASLYALHFFLEARELGFAVPEDLVDKALEYAQSESLRNTSSIFAARQFAYALYLQARAGKVPGNDISFLHKALQTNYKKTWANDLAAAYLAAAYKLVKQDEQGDEIFSQLTVGEKVEPNYGYFYDGFERDTTVLYLAAKHFPTRLKSLGTAESLGKAVQPLTRGQYNTYSAAHAILALDALMRNADRAEVVAEMRLEEVLASGPNVPLSLPESRVGLVEFSDKAEKIHYQTPASTPMFYMQLQNGFDRDLPKTEIKRNLEVVRDYLTAKDEIVNHAKVGEELTVRLRVRAMEKGTYENVVLVDLLPGGFESVFDKSSEASESFTPSNGPNPNDGSDGEGEGEETPPATDGDEGAAYHFLDALMPRAWAEGSARVLASVVSALSPHYVDRREDRMVIYATVTDQAQEFRYKVKAVSEGKFTVPPPYGESMYDHQMVYRGLSPSFTIEAP